MKHFGKTKVKLPKPFSTTLLPELLGTYFTRESDIENRYMVD